MSRVDASPTFDDEEAPAKGAKDADAAEDDEPRKGGGLFWTIFAIVLVCTFIPGVVLLLVLPAHMIGAHAPETGGALGDDPALAGHDDTLVITLETTNGDDITEPATLSRALSVFEDLSSLVAYDGGREIELPDFCAAVVLSATIPHGVCMRSSVRDVIFYAQVHDDADDSAEVGADDLQAVLWSMHCRARLDSAGHGLSLPSASKLVSPPRRQLRRRREPEPEEEEAADGDLPVWGDECSADAPPQPGASSYRRLKVAELGLRYGRLVDATIDDVNRRLSARQLVVSAALDGRMLARSEGAFRRWWLWREALRLQLPILAHAAGMRVHWEVQRRNDTVRVFEAFVGEEEAVLKARYVDEGEVDEVSRAALGEELRELYTAELDAGFWWARESAVPAKLAALDAEHTESLMSATPPPDSAAGADDDEDDDRSHRRRRRGRHDA